jgi:hypothetical protein
MESLHGGAGKTHLCNVSVQGEGVGNAEDQKNHNGTSVGEQPQKRHVVERRKHRIHDFGYCVAYNDAKGHHAAKCTARYQH